MGFRALESHKIQKGTQTLVPLWLKGYSALESQTQKAQNVAQRAKKRENAMQAYTFPDFPNVESRQTIGAPLRDGRVTNVSPQTPNQSVAKNANPDTYVPQANQPVYGTQVFNQSRGYQEFPQPNDIVSRWYTIKIQEGLFYRENMYNASQQQRAYAVVTPSITTPSLGARFVNARGRGDVYGA